MTIWAVTSYFNPGRFRRRYQNFLAFREALELPLLTVEWALSGDFELSRGDSDRLVSVAGGDLMWQKERLLNLGIAELPPSCDTVVWLDCDILFEDGGWLDEIDAGLARAPIAQLFSEVVHLHPDEGAAPLLVRESLAASQARGGDWELPGIRSGARGPAPRGDDGEADERRRLAARPSSGHAWAARRDLLARHGLYDACVCGVGDMAVALAALGRQDLFPAGFPLNRRQQAHYRAWADRFAAATGGAVGCLAARVQHLFHGNLGDRQYRSRVRWLADSGFDPAKDLVLDGQGLWRWRKAFRVLEGRMREYFERRSEDAEVRWRA